MLRPNLASPRPSLLQSRNPSQFRHRRRLSPGLNRSLRLRRQCLHRGRNRSRSQFHPSQFHQGPHRQSQPRQSPRRRSLHRPNLHRPNLRQPSPRRRRQNPAQAIPVRVADQTHLPAARASGPISSRAFPARPSPAPRNRRLRPRSDPRSGRRWPVRYRARSSRIGPRRKASMPTSWLRSWRGISTQTEASPGAHAWSINRA